MRMARVNIYLPDELAEQAKDADLNVSGLAQAAIRRHLRSAETARWLDEVSALPPIEVDAEVVADAIAGAKDEIEGLA